MCLKERYLTGLMMWKMNSKKRICAIKQAHYSENSMR